MDKSETNVAQGVTRSSGGAGPEPRSPAEPFPCPNCGQLLAPTCKVCVACHETIDFSKVQRVIPAPPALAPEARKLPERRVRTHFSWPIFFVVLCVYLAIYLLANRYLNALHDEMVLGGILVISSTWVLYDARARQVPHPFRWSVSSLLLWIIAFPWYLSRRRAPQDACPLMDAQPRVFIRALVWIVLILFVLSLIAAAVAHKPLH